MKYLYYMYMYFKLCICIILGTRSKKRGLDETGACANYVETEQVWYAVVLNIINHKKSVQSHDISEFPKWRMALHFCPECAQSYYELF